MLRLRIQKIGSILGMLAILMTALAPTVSQALAARGRVDALLGTFCSAQPDSTQSTSSSGSTDKSTLSHLQACGYCNLLAHTPAMPSVTATFASTVWSIQHRAATRFESLRRAQPLTAAQPRAPPVLA